MSVINGVRVAIEGCGHGTLDAIYASVQKSCEIKGWDGVDVLIICGDFQAVRTRQDLNVTAMPAKYREMGDFHQYYYGAKTAPYLTVFIGGNHEASNYLFELYYGGWVAPNIYYMGAANVLQLGPLKIAALSGIYKRHDYSRQHFERLPYNENNIRSIYHQREVDVRKLLAYRSQVDIGLSHDWPHDIWQYGDHEFLFRVKSHFRSDAYQGELGSKAVTDIVDRLRPPYWFSAHLHFKYTAFKPHLGLKNQQSGSLDSAKVHDQSPVTMDAVPLPTSHTGKANRSNNSREITDSAQPSLSTTLVQDDGLSDWSNYGSYIQAQDAKLEREAHDVRREREQRHGKQTVVNYNFDQTFKQINITEVDNVQSRQALPPYNAVPGPPQFDGSSVSLPKRRRVSSSSDANQNTGIPGVSMESKDVATKTFTNPDAIVIDFSDSDEGGTPSPVLEETKKADDKVQAVSETKLSTIDVSDSIVADSAFTANNSSINRSPRADTTFDTEPRDPNHGRAQMAKPLQHENNKSVSDVPEELRAQLAEMSTTFAEKVKVDRSPDLPFPDGIKSTSTRFLALSKVETGHDREFLQLLEIQNDDGNNVATESFERPLKLKYDPEWLAIVRAFASELETGGFYQDKITSHRGETFYRTQIVEQERWIDEHVTSKSLLNVPENFTITVQKDEDHNAVGLGRDDMPLEQTNPQTAQFCELVGIENKFDFSQENRDSRVAKGPEPSIGGGRGRGGGRGANRSRARGRGGGRRGRWS